MAEQKATRRQKDISRLIKERSRTVKDKAWRTRQAPPPPGMDPKR